MAIRRYYNYDQSFTLYEHQTVLTTQSLFPELKKTGHCITEHRRFGGFLPEQRFHAFSGIKNLRI